MNPKPVTPPHPHETHAQHEAQAHHEKPAPSSDSKVLMEGTGGIKVVRFTVNGQVKSLNLPVTGAELHRVAGGAVTVTVGGTVIANDTEPVDLPDDAEVIAAY
jgi:hypothetical protein